MFRKKTYSLDIENSQIHLEQTCNKMNKLVHTIFSYHIQRVYN